MLLIFTLHTKTTIASFPLSCSVVPSPVKMALAAANPHLWFTKLMFLINYIYMEEWFINFARLARLRNSYWTYDGEQTKLLDVCCVKLNNQHLPSQATRYPLNFQLSHFPFLAPFLIQVRHWIKIDNICNFRSRQSDGRTPSLLFFYK